jgi:hypothetical protein
MNDDIGLHQPLIVAAFLKYFVDLFGSLQSVKTWHMKISDDNLIRFDVPIRFFCQLEAIFVHLYQLRSIIGKVA